jgi:phosphoglycerol transferase
MTKNKETARCGYALIIVLSAVFLFLIVRNSGLYPLIFPDEYKYSVYSRLMPFSEAQIPGYLYYAVYRVTKFCGDGSLECARVLNAVFFLSAMPFIYLIGREVTGPRTALFVAVCSALGPLNYFTAYFMPESMYLFVFWLFIYLLHRFRQEISGRRILVLGAVLGLLALVKPHALLLIPAVMAYVVVMPLSGNTTRVSRIWLCTCLLAAALLVKLSIGFALAGANGLCLFGANYTDSAAGTLKSISSTAVPQADATTAVAAAGRASGLHRCLEVAGNATMNLQGHLLALCLLFSIPMAGLILDWRSWLKSSRSDRPDQLSVITALILMDLLAVVVLFATVYVGTEPNEIATRLHARYYTYIFPLLLMVAARYAAPVDDPGSGLKWRVISAAPVGAAVCYAAYTRMVPYFFNPVDFPELTIVTAKQGHFTLICGLALISLAAWVWSSKSGARIFLYLFVPALVYLSSVYMIKELHNRRIPDDYDRAGLFARNYLTRAEHAKVHIVGSDRYKLYRPLLCLDNPVGSPEIIPVGAPYDASRLPDTKEWALVIGDHPVPDNVFYKISLNGYMLVRLRKPRTLDFRTDSLHGVVSSISGLNAYRSDVGYSTGKEVVIRFCNPLPEQFKLMLKAYAIGPNVGRNFIVSTGSRRQEFSLGASAADKILEIVNPDRSNVITLHVPQPAAMESWGPKMDNTLFGLVLVDLRIDSL